MSLAIYYRIICSVLKGFFFNKLYTYNSIELSVCIFAKTLGVNNFVKQTEYAHK